jgi:hypothetical protein
MKCNDFEAGMVDLLNGSLEEPEHREALEHALACPKCESLLYEQQRLDLELKTLAAGEWSGQASPGLEQQLTTAFREQAKKSISLSPGAWASVRRFISGEKKWKYATAVISLALCIVASSSLWKRPQVNPIEIVDRIPMVESVSPMLNSQPQELATIDSKKLPVVHHLRQRSRMAPDSVQAEWMTTEVATDFFTIPYVEPFRPNDRVRVVRIQVPYSTLADFGFPVYSDQALRPVQADVMVGDDNVARTIRFVEQWRLQREQAHPVIKQAVH